MFKKTAVAALMGVCSLAHAEFYEINATYTGFNDINGQFQADKKLTLSATVNDLDNNGVFTVNEVRAFSFGSLNIDPEFIVPGGCGFGWDNGLYCLDAFSYTQGGALSFSASYSYHDESTVSIHATSGDEYYSYYNSNGGGSYYYYRWYWTPQTQVSVTLLDAAPVPEPATYAMLGAGLLAVGAFARRRRG